MVPIKDDADGEEKVFTVNSSNEFFFFLVSMQKVPEGRGESLLGLHN